MNSPQILLARGHGFISTLIGWQTRSIEGYTHAAFYLPNGTILESWQGKGVQIRPGPLTDDWSGIDVFSVPTATQANWDAALAYAHAQIGKPYDYVGCLRFVTRRPIDRFDDAWFCSELVFESMRIGGIHLLERIPAWAVDPAKLSTWPLLQPITPHPYFSTADTKKDSL